MALVVAFYRVGLETLTPSSWAIRATDEVLLIGHGTGWTFDDTDSTLTDLALGSTELAAVAYSRKALVPGTPVYSAGRWSLPLAATVWPTLGAAEDVAAVVGFEAGVDDTVSYPLWAIYDDGGDPIVTLDGTDLTVSYNLGVT